MTPSRLPEYTKEVSNAKGVHRMPTKKPTESQVTRRVIVDWGNDSIKVLQGDRDPLVIRSLYVTVPSYYGTEDLQPGSPDSPIVLKDGVTTHWGHQARYYSGYSSTVREDKTALITKGLWAALGAIDGETEYAVELTLSVPHLKRFKHQFPGFAESLKGVHSYSHNGQVMQTELTSVSVVPESLGSFRLAQKLGYTDQRLALVIDLGCGTSIYSLFKPDGTLVELLCREKAGVVSLVDRLRADPALIREVGDTPDAETVLEGLRDQTFLYGAVGTDFSAMAMAHGAVWWREVVKDALVSMHPWRTQISSVVLTGGGANLARVFGYTKEILPECQLANLRGLAL